MMILLQILEMKILNKFKQDKDLEINLTQILSHGIHGFIYYI